MEVIVIVTDVTVGVMGSEQFEQEGWVECHTAI